MSNLTLYKGRKGADGADGADGLGPESVNDYRIENPLITVFTNNTISYSADFTFDRSTPATYTDIYGNLNWTNAKARTNYCPYSQYFQFWNDFAGTWSIIGSATDPFGRNYATEIELDSDTDSLSPFLSALEIAVSGMPSTGYKAVSFWIKRISGEISSSKVNYGSSVYSTGPVSDEWERKVLKVESTSSVLFGITPEGKAGARFAIFGVQIEETKASNYIPTVGFPVTVTDDYANISRRGFEGVLFESEKTNLIHHSHDLEDWMVTGGSVDQSTTFEFLGFNYMKSRVVFASLETVTLETTTDSLTEGVEYTVSFFAYVSGGSLTSITASLGGGEEVLFSQPSVTGYERISGKVTAGAGSGLTVNVNSDALNAKLDVCCFQVEEGELSSYIEAAQVSSTRGAELLSCDYAFNAPAPDGEWTFVFRKGDIKNDSRKKTVFSNGEPGANEFSLYFTDSNLVLNNGGNLSSYNMLSSKRIAVTYDGANVKFYNEQKKAFETTSSSTSFIATTLYIGSGSSGENLEAEISDCMFYNEALSAQDLLYIMGD